MRTTTDRRRGLGFPVRGLVVVLVVWFAGMAAVAYVFDPAAVIVFAPQRTAVTAIATADGNLINSGFGFATGTSDRSGFVRRLYAQGAWFVWPSLTRGCFAPDRFTR
jgi:hypothetical protein